MDIAESRLSAMESIGENLLRADNILKNEDRGIISDIYDLYKIFRMMTCLPQCQLCRHR